MLGLKSISIHKKFARPKSAATAVVDKVEIFLCLEGIINFEEERKRLQKEMEKILKDLDFVSKKLSNDDFLSRAPEEIVNKERDKARMLKEKGAKLRDNVERISELCA